MFSAFELSKVVKNVKVTEILFFYEPLPNTKAFICLVLYQYSYYWHSKVLKLAITQVFHSPCKIRTLWTITEAFSPETQLIPHWRSYDLTDCINWIYLMPSVIIWLLFFFVCVWMRHIVTLFMKSPSCPNAWLRFTFYTVLGFFLKDCWRRRIRHHQVALDGFIPFEWVSWMWCNPH